MMDLDELVDFQLLLMEMPETPCESTSHNDADYQMYHGGPGKFYMKLNHNCSKPAGVIYPVCAPYAEMVEMVHKDGRVLNCIPCNTLMYPEEWGEVVGPVS